MNTFPSIGIQVPKIYLPAPGVDLTRWAVIACDQYTSQPEYWTRVENLVGTAPSTLNLIFPEVYLETHGVEERIARIQQTMKKYLADNILTPVEGFVYIERSVSGRTRRGLLMCLDLEQYDFSRGSQSLIRATEGTIIERLPPRIRIRQGAPLELPHILVLIDDPHFTVLELVEEQKAYLKKLYDFDLMFDSGHLTGYLVDDPDLQMRLVRGLEYLAAPETFTQKYGLDQDQKVLLFAMGDGNHSLATAKAIWEKIKPTVGMQHPARYALVEVENVHDTGLEFEPIHRVLFGLKQDILAAMRDHFGDAYSFQACLSPAEMQAMVDTAESTPQVLGVINAQGSGIVRITHPTSNLPVGTLQAFLDTFIKQGGAEKIDYVHGAEVVINMSSQAGNVGFYLPGMHKGELFKTVILDGALPRKTFSMGEAREKRFYMEARKIA